MDQLSRAMGFAPEDDHHTRWTKVREFLERLALPLDEGASVIAALLGVAAEGCPSTPMHPEQWRRLTLDALVGVVLAIAREHRLLFVVEDAHWFDPTTQELTNLIMDAIQDRPVMMLVTTRPEYRPPWSGVAHFSTLSLTRLSRRETEHMISSLTGTKLPPEILSQLVARTDGVRSIPGSRSL